MVKRIKTIWVAKSHHALEAYNSLEMRVARQMLHRPEWEMPCAFIILSAYRALVILGVLIVCLSMHSLFLSSVRWVTFLRVRVTIYIINRSFLLARARWRNARSCRCNFHQLSCCVRLRVVSDLRRNCYKHNVRVIICVINLSLKKTFVSIFCIFLQRKHLLLRNRNKK